MENTQSLEEAGFITNRGVDAYAEAFAMERREFLSWLAGKGRVLDIGSGGGLLSKEIDLLRQKGEFQSDTNIASFDLSYASAAGKKESYYATHLAYQHIGVAPQKADIRASQEKFKKTAVAGTFRNLPFESGAFDAVIASYSFGIAVKDKEQLMSAFREVYRVMDKNRGSGLITVAFDEDTGMLRSGSVNNPVYYTFQEISFLKPKLRRTKTRISGVEVNGYYLEVGIT